MRQVVDYLRWLLLLPLLLVFGWCAGGVIYFVVTPGQWSGRNAVLWLGFLVGLLVMSVLVALTLGGTKAGKNDLDATKKLDPDEPTQVRDKA